MGMDMSSRRCRNRKARLALILKVRNNEVETDMIALQESYPSLSGGIKPHALHWGGALQDCERSCANESPQRSSSSTEQCRV